MSRHFDGINDFLEIAEAVLTVQPLTFAAWINADQLATTKGDEMSIVSISSVASEFFRMRIDDSTTDGVQYIARNNLQLVKTTAEITALNWHHCVCRASDNNNRAVYLDGGNKVTDIGVSTPASVDTTTIGSIIATGDTHSDLFDGLIADVAIWNAALTDDEIRLLFELRLSPLLMRPESLVMYCPLYKAEDYDVIGGRVFTVGGAPLVGSTVPGLRYPSWFIPGERRRVNPVNPPIRRRRFRVPDAVGGLSVPVAMRSYRNWRVG